MWTNPTRLAIVALGFGAVVFVVATVWSGVRPFFGVVFVLFAAWLIAANIRRLAIWIERRGRVGHRTSIGLAYIAVVVPIGALVYLVAPLALGQAIALARALPLFFDEIPAIVAGLQRIADDLGLEVDVSAVLGDDLRASVATSISQWLNREAISLTQRAVNWLLQGVFVAALSFYIVLDWDHIVSFVRRITPERWHYPFAAYYRSIDGLFSGWLRGVVIVASVYGVVVFVVLTALGTSFGLPVALLAAIFVVMPVVGDTIAILLPASLTWADQSAVDALIVALTLGFADFILINLIISPRVMSRAVNLPPVFIFVSIILGTRLLGPIGAFLAVPLGGLVYFSATLAADHIKNTGTEAGQTPMTAPRLESVASNVEQA